MLDLTIRLNYNTEGELFDSFLWDRFLSNAITSNKCESFQITDWATYRAHLRERIADARINGLDTKALLETIGYNRFTAIPDDELPTLADALDEALKGRREQTGTVTATQTLAEHVYQLLTSRATEREARVIYTFAQSLLTPKQ